KTGNIKNIFNPRIDRQFVHAWKFYCTFYFNKQRRRKYCCFFFRLFSRQFFVSRMLKTKTLVGSSKARDYKANINREHYKTTNCVKLVLFKIGLYTDH